MRFQLFFKILLYFIVTTQGIRFIICPLPSHFLKQNGTLSTFEVLHPNEVPTHRILLEKTASILILSDLTINTITTSARNLRVKLLIHRNTINLKEKRKGVLKYYL